MKMMLKDIYTMQFNKRIRILSFTCGKYTVESNNGKWIECGRYDSFGKALNSAKSLNKHLGGK
jgi:hypothetical protein